MPFNIVTVPAKAVTINNVKMVVLQCQATQLSQLYGIEVQCKTGFSTDPNMTIYVFNNPKAAEALIKSKTSSTTFKLTDYGLRCDSNITYEEDYPGAYIITAQKVNFPSNHVTESPLGIPGCEYNSDPKPFVTKGKYQGFENDAFLTIVIIGTFPNDNVTVSSIFIQK